jgi:diacylglycerol kinase family enzyme
MKKYHVLYNSFAGSGDESYKNLSEKLDGEVVFHNVIETDYEQLFASFTSDDIIVVCGGDGSLNKFVNRTKSIKYDNDVLYFATGTGNDFLKDLELSKDQTPIKINEYIKKLPVCYLNGEEHLFINGVGFGIDGYCCEEGDKLRAANAKKIDYTAIAIKGLLFKYKPTGVTITVDGVSTHYDKTWILIMKEHQSTSAPAPAQILSWMKKAKPIEHYKKEPNRAEPIPAHCLQTIEKLREKYRLRKAGIEI